ncbi:hypothetical protein [Helicobacter cetorum]|uniref:hypothetical protein n=1 Tax=Helicobacter cetorum TaxID=138563 RepID=UPI000CF13622|nr:hypothetical protein [Helicobacter cetorum]
MLLYDKVQELINESKELKLKNAEVLELARNELNELVDNKSKENLETLKQDFNSHLENEFSQMPEMVKNNVSELVNQNEVKQEVLNALLAQFNKPEISNELKRELKFEIKAELESLLTNEELQRELKLARSAIVEDTTLNTENALKQQILSLLENRLPSLIESVVKNLDFSFLKSQPKAFYSVINDNLKEMFLKELESESLKSYIDNLINEYFKKAKNLEKLRESELKAFLYLQVVLETNKVKLLQDALMQQNQILQDDLKIKNEIAYQLKRKELIKEGKLDDESFKHSRFKVV